MSRVNVPETFVGLAFYPDGSQLFASGAEDEVVHQFAFAKGFLSDHRKIRIADAKEKFVPAGLSLGKGGQQLYVANPWGDTVALVPLEEPWRHRHLSYYQHPLRADLQRAVHDDEQLSKMYPSDDGDFGRRGAIMNSLGRGGTIQSVLFGETLIGAAWDLALMSTLSPSLADLYEAISGSLDVLRAALAGGPTETRALLAFTGLTTAGRSVETPWGSLRPIADHERAAAPPMLEGAVSGTDDNGRSVTVSYGGEVVLATSLPFALKVVVWEPGAGLSNGLLYVL